MRRHTAWWSTLYLMRTICGSPRFRKPSLHSRSPSEEELAQRVSGPEVLKSRPDVPEELFSILTSLPVLLLSHLIHVSSRLSVSATLPPPCLGFHGNRLIEHSAEQKLFQEKEAAVRIHEKFLLNRQDAKPQRPVWAFKVSFILFTFYCFAVNSHFYCPTEIGWIGKTN